MKSTLLIFAVCMLLPMLHCQIAVPRIEVARRIRLNAVYVKWSVPNQPNYNLTKSRVLVSNGESSIVWPSQAVKVNKDGGDAVTLGPALDKTYLECIEACVDSPQCRFIVSSGRTCYLKASVPTAGPCAPRDECAAILAYSNEANLYDLPMNTSFRLEIQVYDSKSKMWSNYSQPSAIISTDYMKPQLSSPIDILSNGNVRLKWKIAEESIIKPTRYRVSLSRKSQEDVKEWPVQMQETTIDGPASEEDKYSSQTTSAVDCKNACVRNPKCYLAVRDTRFCYLKGFPASNGTCGSQNGCWGFAAYQPVAELENLPFDEVYRFRVAVYDEYSNTWSLLSDYSEEFNQKISVLIRTERVDQSTYRVYFRQDKAVYPIARMRVLVSVNNSVFSNDVKSENLLKQNIIARNETTFNTQAVTNLGRMDDLKCFQACYEDFKCVGIKIKDGNCYASTSFDPFLSDPCSKDEKCISISNNANGTILQNLEASTNYKIRVEFVTKYNTRGFSNIEEFNVPK